ncbi:hypothetical protein D3C83_140180 [compost metagenome]
MDHFSSHFDMALHAEMLAEGERLVLAILVREHALRAGRDGKRLAVPVKRLE